MRRAHTSKHFLSHSEIKEIERQFWHYLAATYGLLCTEDIDENNLKVATNPIRSSVYVVTGSQDVLERLSSSM